MRIISIIICLFLIQTIVQAGDPWPLGKGNSYTQISYSFLPYRYYFNSEKEIVKYESDDFDDYQNRISTFQFYSDFGLSDHITMNVRTELKNLFTINKLNTGTSTSSLLGFGNSQIRVNYSNNIFGIQTSLGIGLDLPSAESADNGRDMILGFEEIGYLSTVSIGKGYSNFYWRAQATGYIRDLYSNRLDVDFEFGYQINSSTWLAIASNNRFSDRLGTADLSLSEQGRMNVFFSDQQEFQAIGLKGSYSINEKIGITGGVYGAFGGRNIAASPSYNFGVYFK